MQEEGEKLVTGLPVMGSLVLLGLYSSRWDSPHGSRHVALSPHWPVVLMVCPFQGVEVSPKVEAVLSLLSAQGLSLKLVRPKALLDNCFRVMELLYCSCCKEL